MIIKDIKLFKKQYEVFTDFHRFKVICAGRKFGKSTLAIVSALGVMGSKPNQIVSIICPTFAMARDIYWRDIEKIPSLIPFEAIEKKNDSELYLQLKNGSFLYLRGSDRPDTLRGLRFDYVILDEFSQMKTEVWEQIVQPNLLATKGKAMFISTPYGYDKFYDLFMKGQGSDPEWKSWRFTSYDNPYIDLAVIDQAKKDTDEDSFAQEYLAEFRRFKGLVYKDFSRENTVIEPVELQPNWTYYRAIDFGFINQTAVIFLAITDKGELIIFDEIYQSGLKTPDLADLIAQRSLGRTYTNTIADSAQISDIEELRHYGFGITPVSKTSGSQQEDWTTFRIRKVAEKLLNKSLKIFSSCPNLIFEFENYRYHEVKEDRQIKEEPMKLNDHLLDALSYLIVNLPEHFESVNGENREDMRLYGQDYSNINKGLREKWIIR